MKMVTYSLTKYARPKFTNHQLYGKVFYVLILISGNYTNLNITGRTIKVSGLLIRICNSKLECNADLEAHHKSRKKKHDTLREKSVWRARTEKPNITNKINTLCI